MAGTSDAAAGDFPPSAAAPAVQTPNSKEAGAKPHHVEPLDDAPKVKKVGEPSKRLYPGPKPPTPEKPLNTTTSSGKKVTGASDRLIKQPARRQLPPVDPGPKLEAAKQEQLVQRLYQASFDKIQSRQEKNEVLLKKNDWPTSTISREALDEMVQRMYNNQKQHDAQVAKQLVSKYVKERSRTFMSAEQVEESNKRLYYESCTKKAESMEKLYNQYVTERTPVFPKVTQDEMAATTSRLFTKG